MKTRRGFVSNSSSSSFVVVYEVIDSNFKYPEGMSFDERRKVKIPHVKVLLDETYQKLVDFGFRRTDICDPMSVYCMSNCYGRQFKEEGRIQTDEGHYLFWNCSSNHYDAIEFLVKLNIPFKAVCHYGHWYVEYKEWSDHVVHVANFGQEYATYHDTTLRSIVSSSPIRREPVKEIIEQAIRKKQEFDCDLEEYEIKEWGD